MTCLKEDYLVTLLTIQEDITIDDTNFETLQREITIISIV